ncbi:MAG: DevR family CRISPR-associated autoregulator [Crenarchaeota archaeon]|nr:DevR family CRISPR-associated autoregulator [Thermoproteota archaeon]
MQFALTAKLLINMHDLNNEGAEEIRRIPLIFKTKDGYRLVNEAVAVSGVMLKHWHAVYLVRRAEELGVNLCPLCRRGEFIRVPPPDAVKKEWLHTDEETYKKYVNCLKGTEEDLIKLCVGEDAHGFLRTKPPLRRESLIKFSWLLPISLEGIEVPPFRVVQHTRNIREVPKDEELRKMQMPYPRSYADGIYGFTSLCDLELVGIAFTCRKQAIDDNEKKRRQRAILEAFIPMLTGAFGASLARSLPAAKPLEVVAIVSKEAKIGFPAPVHPMYEDYFQLNERLFRSFAKEFNVDLLICAYGVGQPKKEDKMEIKIVDDPAETIVTAIEYLGLSKV